MKGVLVLVLVLLVLPGCDYLLPRTNQPPKAYIDDISPAEAVEGEVITFRGHGTDADGDVVAYRWRSTLDGQLSTLPEFETEDLSPGSHVIYFMVQDNNGAWSAEARSTVAVEAGPVQPARINSFTASEMNIVAGNDTTLSWNVSNATDISIDQGIGDVQAVASMTVSPEETTTYTLRAEGGGAVAVAKITVTVEQPELDIVFFDAEPEAVPSGEVATLSWETTGATEVRIDPIIGVVDPVGSVDVSPTGEQTYTFTLIATDEDETISAQVEVDSYLLMPDSHTVVLEPVVSESGYVRSNGQLLFEYMDVGDNTDDLGVQAFLSFDISDIPEDAMITGVTVDFSDHTSTFGTPFDDLGCLRAYVHDYGTLDSGDYYEGTPSDAISRWCDMSELEEAGSDADYKEALEDRLGEDRLQLRLQFRDADTDSDGTNDLVRWNPDHLPRLTVHYYSYD